MGVAVLVITAFQWSFLWTPLLVIGMAAGVVCVAMAGYYLVRSYTVRPPSSDQAADSAPDHADQNHPTSEA